MLRYMASLILLTAVWVANPASSAVPADFLYRNTGPGDTGMPYRIFLPPGYDPGQNYPLIVFLHGAGEAGTNNTSQLNNNANGALKLVSDANLAIQPTFMAAPQCPTNSSCWGQAQSLQRLNAMLDQIAAEFSIDADRVHVTGLSMGGHGTWSLVQNRPDRFASAVPMSGYGGGSATAMSGIPFWYFHAANDGTVGVAGSRNQVNALRAANARVIYTEYATGGHGIWSNSYGNALLFPWIMAQWRGNPSLTTPPVVRIEQPTQEPVWITDLAQTPLSGVFDNDGASIASVAWSRRNGPNGTANGTTLWNTPSIDLELGINDLIITGTGSSYYANYGGATTINANLRANRVTSIPEPGDTVIAINSAGPDYNAIDGTAFVADSAFEGGSTQVSSHVIANTADDTLYNSWRWGNFAYRIPVANGRYEIDLHFAETYNSAAGQRRFNVTLQGVPILQEFDIAAEAGLDTALVRHYVIDVDGGEILIQFSNGSVGSARVDAVHVVLSDDVLFASGFDPD
ncbi:malectin domain-containing carbohydrate-binding protein [Dokdonella sp.]|uniref:malectin domain-containing carbohydrate-binding protein n=1 Tax=Dokdonella sp. TaxID=2291710 RepID=UPI00352739D9